MYAASGNPNTLVITTLLRAGADINALDTSSRTPLMYAASGNQNPEVILAMLKGGADTKAKDNAKLKGTDVLKILSEAAH